MPTTYHKLSGKAVWAKVHRPDNKYNTWSIGLVFDDEGLAQWKKLRKEFKLGSRTNETEGTPGFEDGLEYITLRRKVAKPWGDHSPPEVVDEQGNHIAENLGNGSDVTVEFMVYEYKAYGGGNAMEFTKVTVHNLVRFERPTETTGVSAPVDSGGLPPTAKQARPF